MSTITTTPDALSAYARASQLAGAPGGAAAEAGDAAGFGGILKDVLGSAIETGKDAETAAAQHIAGKGELVDVVTALTAAETTLDTIVAVRDRVISAYQEIERMPI